MSSFFPNMLREERIKVENFCSQTLPLYSDHQFRRTLCVPRNIFSVLLDVMKDDIKYTPHFGGRHPVQPEDKLAVFLKYIGSTDTLLDIGQLFNLTEYSVIKARRKVTEAILNRLLSTTIKWPTPQELNNVTNEFNNITAPNFPGIVGAMDGSHIAIATPLESPHSYFNRKKFHSVVLQAVCKPNLTFIDVCPGRMHDANILRRSELWNPEQLFDDADNDDPDNPRLQPVPNIIRPSNTNAMGQLKRIRITNNL
ncbi:hypothetical protein ACJMK2_043938 [Sinanodonta woodiana]|uniref:DDE Tnp4 domain-containing protein n=1 Tax=Sinanodonta woodiana TaxID=1069815 RepID=A0ABD3VZ92_SINWO